MTHRTRLPALACFAGAIAMGFVFSAMAQGPVGNKPPILPAWLEREPRWRMAGDCGPNSLYAMARICGVRTTLEKVREAVPFDAELGCSLESLANGAETIGMSTEVRFVAPADLRNLEGPFIMYVRGSLEERTGHFMLIVGFSDDRKEFAVIDTDHERYESAPEESVRRLCSGFVLVPGSSGAETTTRAFGFATIVGALGWAFFRFKHAIGRVWRSGDLGV